MKISNFNENISTDCDNSLQNIMSPPDPTTPNPNTPLPCPRCGAMGTESFCRQCGLDLVAFYQASAEANQAPTINMSFSNNQYYTNAPQYAPYTQYSYQMSRQKHRASTIISIIVMIVLSIALVFSIPFLLFSAFNSQKPPISITDKYTDPQITSSKQITRNGISLSEYNDIKLGMSYAHVSAIIGCDGTLSDQGMLPQGTEYYTYTWYGDPDTNVVVHITFKNDVVSEIMEVGMLKDQTQK